MKVLRLMTITTGLYGSYVDGEEMGNSGKGKEPEVQDRTGLMVVLQ